MNNDVMSRLDFSESELAVNDFQYNLQAGSFEATLLMKAQGRKGILRVFFDFEDGRQIIAPVYRWQRYLGFYEMPLGSKVRLTYIETVHGVYLKEAEAL